jgi:acyl-coenzyme A synthetase/AMP-(fatty) acid ligase
MPSYMVPREVMVMGALPKSSGGKVAKAELKTRSG